jgi:hypothetical protein
VINASFLLFFNFYFYLFSPPTSFGGRVADCPLEIGPSRAFEGVDGLAGSRGLADLSYFCIFRMRRWDCK